MAKAKSKARSKLSQFSRDDRNINRHSEEGMDLLKKSVDEVGWTEAIVVSSDDKIISGNARSEIAGEKGIEDAQIVESDGKRPVVIRRKDIKSGTAQFHKAAILANTVAKHNFVEDAEVSEAICEEYNLDQETYGLEPSVEGEETTIRKVQIEPYKKTHVLISFPPEKLIHIAALIEQIEKVEGVEIEQSSN